jgi:RNA polymerase sigma-70 factor (ECF subfamily)
MENNKYEEKLIQNALNGSQEDINKLISLYQPFIVALLKQSSKHDYQLIEQVKQDASIKIFEAFKKHKYKHEQRFSAWVSIVVKNRLTDYYRKFAAERRNEISCHLAEIEEHFHNAVSDNAEDNLIIFDDKIIDDYIIRLYEELPDEQKQVLKMKIFDQKTFNEISKILHISADTARGRYRRGKATLRDRFLNEK